MGGAGYDHIHPDGTPKQAPDTRTQVAKRNVQPGKTADRADDKGLGVHIARRVLWLPVATYATSPKTAAERSARLPGGITCTEPPGG